MITKKYLILLLSIITNQVYSVRIAIQNYTESPLSFRIYQNNKNDKITLKENSQRYIDAIKGEAGQLQVLLQNKWWRTIDKGPWNGDVWYALFQNTNPLLNKPMGSGIFILFGGSSKKYKEAYNSNSKDQWEKVIKELNKKPISTVYEYLY